ncbi:sodium- and chloride-dependent glycine transporter 1-like [Scaptodrosophila lebanonensis]|uniref:Sodium- and chloride-dependent glycine transporter 1-like n=1 Tax=Drosophila lebanonensis TaxID=7225 RepID=A0A6J2U8S0_DROLE|nr:sodium- and chloride-dependent glycine transporter 1-like [Scaptodrosophila lebanonensis]
MVYETSYECGRHPFKPDLLRGKWEQPHDFVFACLGLGLKLDVFSASYWYFYDMGLSGILPYYVYMAIYLVPLMVIHTFMGQFSSSGFISAFRISPFFKGMGYVSLALSSSVLTYYSLFASIPFLFAINSLKPTLPWSCEGIKDWPNLPNDTETICNISTSQVNESDYDNELFDMKMIHVPAMLFFKQQFEKLDMYIDNDVEYNMSFPIVWVTMLVWGLVSFIFYQFNEAPKFGKCLRYMVSITLGLLLVCFLRFLFLPGALSGIEHYVRPDFHDFIQGAASIPVFALQAFGAGWGSIMSLSSFNKFKTNIMSHSWFIAFGQLFIFMLFGLVSFMLLHYFKEITPENINRYMQSHWVLFIPSASVLASLEWANMWTFMYYTMLLMASVIVIVTQIFTILNSLFDEFEQLRQYKQEVTYGFIISLALCSLYFCSNHGVLYFTALSMDSLLVQALLHLLLLLVVLWIYGRERFQRDIKFMIGETFASWKINVLRFVAPLFLLFTLLTCVIVAFMEHSFSSSSIGFISIVLVITPLLYIPSYGVYIMFRNTGSFCMRFKRACRATDWYPLEMEDRQRYEEALGTNDLTHQLYEVTDDMVYV